MGSASSVAILAQFAAKFHGKVLSFRRGGPLVHLDSRCRTAFPQPGLSTAATVHFGVGAGNHYGHGHARNHMPPSTSPFFVLKHPWAHYPSTRIRQLVPCPKVRLPGTADGFQWVIAESRTLRTPVYRIRSHSRGLHTQGLQVSRREGRRFSSSWYEGSAVDSVPVRQVPPETEPLLPGGGHLRFVISLVIQALLVGISNHSMHRALLTGPPSFHLVIPTAYDTYATCRSTHSAPTEQTPRWRTWCV